MAGSFRALVLEDTQEGVTSSIQNLDESRLPEGDVTVAISHSTLNYKDGMILQGLGRLVRSYPHVPGIDFSGTVECSENSDYNVGDKVILTGWRVGESRWGGFAEKARVHSGWLVPMPDGISEKNAMAIGTAGFTAMLAIMSLEEHGISPSSGPILVTGANGGVGSVATALLNAMGFEVHAATGRPALAERLNRLGARIIIDRSEIHTEVRRPLQGERWAGCVDAVGGETLSNVLTQIKYGGSVAACGLAGGNTLTATVIPFLLRGINLLGIDSVMCPADRRRRAWHRLASEFPSELFEELTEIIGLSELPQTAAKILAGQTVGRVVVDVNG